MNDCIRVFRLSLSAFLVWAALVATLNAQEVSVPDPGLNAAIRQALNKPDGPLTQQDMLAVTNLSACCRNITDIAGLDAARNLTILDLHANSLTNCILPASLSRLEIIDLFQNPLTSFALPKELSRVRILDLGFNVLAQCTLPAGLTNLDTLFLENNRLTNFALPPGLSRLTQLDLASNALTQLAIPPDMIQLLSLGLEGNPLDIFVLTEPLAATNLAAPVTSLRNQGVEVFAYALTPRLFQFRQSHDAFQFSLTGPPGDYTIVATEDLRTWSPVRTIKNRFGIIGFTDVPTPFPLRRFYRAQRGVPIPDPS